MIKKAVLVLSLLLVLVLLSISCSSIVLCESYSKVNVPLSTRISYDNEGIAVLMYHHLAPQGVYTATEQNGSIVSVESFNQQMRYLRQNNYQTLFLSELVELLRLGVSLPRKTVVITFDDGYESNYQYAWPILKKYRLKSNINLVVKSSLQAEKIAKGNPQKSYDPKVLSHLTLAQMDEMRKRGLVEFHSHTYDLHHMINIDAEGNLGFAILNKYYYSQENRYETQEAYHKRLDNDFFMANRFLKDYLGNDQPVLAYPYGVFNDTVIFMCQKSGSPAALGIKSGLVTKDSDLYALPRIAVGPQDSIEDFAYKVEYGQNPP
ncbi:MAG: polysaccharide deacetylase family protein [Bacillota bacterium]|jgi:biofilm PGA synthesis lipoprotein PgaB